MNEKLSKRNLTRSTEWEEHSKNTFINTIPVNNEKQLIEYIRDNIVFIETNY